MRKEVEILLDEMICSSAQRAWIEIDCRSSNVLNFIDETLHLYFRVTTLDLKKIAIEYEKEAIKFAKKNNLCVVRDLDSTLKILIDKNQIILNYKNKKKKKKKKNKKKK